MEGCRDGESVVYGGRNGVRSSDTTQPYRLLVCALEFIKTLTVERSHSTGELLELCELYLSIKQTFSVVDLKL